MQLKLCGTGCKLESVDNAERITSQIEHRNQTSKSSVQRFDFYFPRNYSSPYAYR